MAKTKKSFINYQDAVTRRENWINGINTKYKCGDVVERGTDIGVICLLLSEIETYQVKWYRGPKPWDFIEGKAFGNQLTLSEKPNPLKYTHSERFPGPSSTQIDALNKAFAKQPVKQRSSKEIDEYLSILEEEMTKNKDIDVIKTSEDVDSVVDETAEDIDEPIDDIIDVKEIKIKKIIEEE